MENNRCRYCRNWKTGHKVFYSGDQSERMLWESVEGKGNCRILGYETKEDFGCIHFEQTDDPDDQVIIDIKTGEPWQHSDWGPCPECNARGSFPSGGVCGRCCGTARVRYYEDGYIGEEKTRLHPKEVELMKKKRQKPKEPEGTTLKEKAPPDPFTEARFLGTATIEAGE